ncbi:MAG: PCMD domain-containing protein, partial [Alloprevotella sp.]|nr:PCMD domain-containing protein [Alloprevotella sp.]
SRIADPGEPTEWKQFEEPYRPMNGKTFDPERLKAGGYAIAVVMTSSRQGAYFEGAVGSVLYVDELKINWKE